MTGAAHKSVRIHLQTPDWAISSALSVPAAPAPIEAWLPFLHSLASKSAQSAEDAAVRDGKCVSCTKGCGACCRQLVAISLVEARALGRLVADMPQPRQTEIRGRFAEVLRRISESGVLERDFSRAETIADAPLAETEHQRLGAAWFGLSVACPFLDDESCSIHDSRPLVCREYQVTSPAAACSRLYKEPVERVELSVHLGQSLARATAQIAEVSVAMIPLVMALEPSVDVDMALAQPRDMIEMLKIILGEIGDWRIDQ